MSEEESKLGAIVDGATVPYAAAKAFWQEFSEHMDANRGDMAGYAKKKGWFSVLPEYRGGKAVLVVRTTATAKGPPPAFAPQKPKPKPQQKAKPKPPQGGKPQPKAPQKPDRPAKPAAQGGQAPPKKRPT